MRSSTKATAHTPPFSRVTSRRRGGGNANSAAVLVGLIGAVLIAYILTLPPADREELLSGGDGGGGYGGQWGGAAGGAGPLLLLAESPGTLSLMPSPVVEHALPSTTIFTAVNTMAIKELSSVYIKNSLFSREGASITFEADPRSSGNHLLSFNVDDARGNLVVVLNGNVIFNGLITEHSPQPIILPPDEITQGTNEIQLYVGDVGFAFWRKNEYSLRNVLVSADVADYTGASSEQHFTLPEQEYNQLESAQLAFIPECDARETGRLSIEVNHKLLYSGFADCGVLNRVDVSKELVGPGDNAVVFVSDSGSYLLDRIAVVSHLKEEDYPVYYVNLPLELYNPIDIGDAEVLLTLRFADYREEKRGEIVINGFAQTFGTSDFVYQATVDPNILMPGPNTIQVVPHVDELNVAELRIEMV